MYVRTYIYIFVDFCIFVMCIIIFTLVLKSLIKQPENQQLNLSSSIVFFQSLINTYAFVYIQNLLTFFFFIIKINNTLPQHFLFKYLNK